MQHCLTIFAVSPLFYLQVDFNSGSWLVALTMAALAYATVVQENDWDITDYPDERDEYLQHALFAGPPIFLAIMAFIVPIILNPWVLGWPFLPKQRKRKAKRKNLPRQIVDLPTMMKMRKDEEVERTIMETTKEDLNDDDMGSFTTNDLRTVSPQRSVVRRIDPNFIDAKEKEYKSQMERNMPKIEEFNAVDAIRQRSLRSLETARVGNNRSREPSLERGRHRVDALERANLSWAGDERQPSPVRTPPPQTSVSFEEARPGGGRALSSRSRSPGRSGTQHERLVSPPHSPKRDQWGFPR